MKLSEIQLRIAEHNIISKAHVVNDTDKCVYCGKCEKVCKKDAIEVNSKAKSWSIDHSRCVRCKHCIKACPKDALSMQK